jgi:ADP-dependent NAD(P)H-hydrate dehydratase / NAD(P)H-hydrate epimerase
VSVFIIGDVEKGSADFALNLTKIDAGILKNITHVDDLHEDGFDVIVDALFGIGLNKSTDGLHAQVLDRFNKLEGIKVAIDVPSGLFADDNSDNNGVVFKADYTLTFEQPKLAFMFAENAPYVGEFVVLHIGLDANYIATTQSKYYTTEEFEITQLLLPRHKFSHKGTYGHALLVGGSKGKIGAMVLSAKACIRSGAGLTTVAAPNCGYA